MEKTKKNAQTYNNKENKKEKHSACNLQLKVKLLTRQKNAIILLVT